MRALTIDLSPRIGVTEVDPFDGGARAGQEHARSIVRDHAVEDFRLDAQIGHEIIVTCLQHRTRRGGRIAATLEQDR